MKINRSKSGQIEDPPLRRALVVDATDVTRNLRPGRFVAHLVDLGYRVTVLALNTQGKRVHGVEYLQLTLPTGRILGDYYATVLRRLAGVRGGLAFRMLLRWIIRCSVPSGEVNFYDVALVANLGMLEPVLVGEYSTKVLYDANEYHPAEQETSRLWRILRQPEIRRVYFSAIPRAIRVITVSQRLVDRMASELSLDPVLIMNVPRVEPALRDVAPGKPIRAVYHGIAHPLRGISELVNSFQGLNDISLSLYLVGKGRYFQRIRKQGLRVPTVTVEEAVEPHQIQEMLSHFDVGVAFYVNQSFNIQAAMPNKFFEYLLAGIPPIVAPGTSMAAFCEEYNVGFVAKEASYAGFREVLSALTSEMLADQRDNIAIAQRASLAHTTPAHFATALGL
jgi:glycosyltransferase involved in cell wall biosynthesis